MLPPYMPQVFKKKERKKKELCKHVTDENTGEEEVERNRKRRGKVDGNASEDKVL